MKIQTIVSILGVAAATMALTLGLAAPRQVDAIDQEDKAATRITPLISQPVLEVGGLEVKMSLDQPNYAPGDRPVVCLDVTNPTDQRVDTSVWIGMTSSSLASRFSRAPTLPNYLWSKSIPLALAPGETKQLQMATETEIVAGNMVSVTMSNTAQRAAIATLLNLNGGAQSVPNAGSGLSVTLDRSTVGNGVETE